MKAYKMKTTYWKQLCAVFLISLLVLTSLPGISVTNRVTASSPFEDDIQKGLIGLSNTVARAPKTAITEDLRAKLSEILKEAKKLFDEGDVCGAALDLETFVETAKELYQEKQAIFTEEISNTAWTLRQDILSLVGQEKRCRNAERFNRDPIVKIAESDNTHIRGTVYFGEPKMWTRMNEKELYTEIEIPGIQSGIGEPGMPGVPVLFRLIGVPQGAKAIVNQKVGRTRSYRMNLYPFQPEPMDRARNADKLRFPEERFTDPPFAKNKEVYGSDALHPRNIATVTPAGKARDLQMAQLAIAAGQYSPVSHELQLFESVEFEVYFEGGKQGFINQSSKNPFEQSNAAFSGVLLNEAAVSNHVIPDLRLFRCFGEEYLILTHPDFRDAADRLANWKRDKGIMTSVVNVNDGGGPGPDTKETIDGFIESRYSRCLIRPTYVLLLGDAEFIPTFYRVTSGSDTTGTDYPYALLSADEDDTPDFSLGRIPVDTLAQANTVVDKIINYEKHPPSQASFYQNVGIASQFQCCRTTGTVGRDQRSFVETSEFVRNELLNQGYSVDRIYNKTVDANYTGDDTPRRFFNGTQLPGAIGAGSGFGWSGDTDQIIDAFNAGRFLFLHRDHGWEDGWGNPSFTTTNVDDDLTNGSLLPVVFSVNCASGLFDNETADGDYGTEVDREYFAERLLRKENGGAVGMLGDTRNSPTWANSALTRGYFDAVWPNTEPAFGNNTSLRRLGDILNHGKLYLMTQVGVAGTTVAPSQENLTSELYMWHALGDPTLEMWTSRPLRKLIPKFYAQLLRNSISIRYPIDRAKITAFQEVKDSVIPIGRAEIKDGEAVIPFITRPVPGARIQLIAELDNDVSINLTSSNIVK